MTILNQVERELQEALGNSLKAYCQELGTDKLIQPKNKAVQMQQEAMKEIVAFKQRLQEGFKVAYAVIEMLSVLDRSIDFAAFQKNSNDAFEKLHNRQDLERYSKLVVAGDSWREVLGITEETVELLYKAGQEVFTQKRHKDAESVFCFLTTIDPMQYAFWIGLGHARFHLENFSQAVSAYQMASMCDPFALWPYFFSANCYEKQRDFDQALVCLEDAMESYKNQGMQDKEMEEVISQRIATVSRG